MKTDSLNRRDFISRTAAAGVGLGLAGFAQAARAQTESPRKVDANSRLTFAVIGTNGRGLSHIESLGGVAGAEIVAICDVDSRAMEKGIRETAKRQQNKPRGVRDVRELLADKSIDAVTIATPDHWHTPMSIMALAAGKHVYVEKPLSQNGQEGEWLVQAAAKSGRVLQMGNQRRSFPNVISVMEQIHNGVIGKPYFARAWYVNNRKSIGHGKQAPVPPTLDYELWQGPAPRKPYFDNRIPYNWHWFWHWGTGEALNNGTHEVDVARWALNVTFPSRVSSNGGRYHYQDDWETPDTQTIAWDFPEGCSILWEGRSCNSFQDEKLGRGTLIHGTGGTVLIDGNSYTIYDKDNKVVKNVSSSEKGDAGNTLSASGATLDRLHVQNFVDAIRGVHPGTSPAQEGHKSVALLHLGNIAWRVHRELNCDPATGRIQGDTEAAALWRRDYEPGWEPRVPA